MVAEYRSARFLYAGFGVLLLAFVLLATNFYHQFSSASQLLSEETANNDRQAQAAMDMRVAVRERAILLWQMTLLEDPFDRDDLYQEFSRFGSQFHKSRQELLNSNLNEKEAALLSSLDGETGKRAPLLRRFADQLMSGTSQKTYIDSLNSVVSDQVVVSDLLDQLIHLQQQHNATSRQTSATTSERRLIQLIVWMCVFILSGALFAKFVVKSATERNRQLASANAQLDQLARLDNLTGLPNRMCLMEHLSMGLALSRRHDQKGALLFIDLDGFKAINDQHGHDAGDAFLKLISQELQGLRESDVSARLGGDEFVVALFNISSDEQIITVTERLLQRLSAEYDIGNGTLVRASASIGICAFPVEGMTVDSLMKCADNAMYQAKHSGKNRYVIAAQPA